ncbi:hypothetical protein [uncultured Ruminococcus sp.]|uniref:hypothetical protein n=1 Tax=uncultured Ruminococcus sp. TaxID=165186 RepID=UPI0025F7D036|nr:hypothetical protein [uncultured Ruminococcus sp.]
MNKMKLFEAIDLIDDDLIREADISSETSAKRLTEDESAITVSGVEVRGGIRWQRIAALASAFILIAGFGGIGALLHKHRPTRHIEPSEVVIPAATEVTSETADKQTESTETETADTKKTSKTEMKETKESTNTVTDEKTDNKPERVDSYAEDKAENTTSETNVEKPTSEYMDDNMTQIVRKQVELTDKLNSLNYIDACVEAEPEYYFTARDGKVYKLSLSLNFVQRNDANLQASLTPEITDIIKFFINQRAVLATPEQYNMLYGQGTVNETPTSTDDLIFESGLFRKLNALNYQPMTCDGLPEYQIQDNEGNVFDVNLSDGWVWRRNPTNGKPEPEEANLTSETLSILRTLRDRGELNPCTWNPPLIKYNN